MRYYVGGEGVAGDPRPRSRGRCGETGLAVPLLVDRYRLLVFDLPGRLIDASLAGSDRLDPYADRLDRLAAA